MRRGLAALILVAGCGAPGAGTPKIQDLNRMERLADELERDGSYVLAREQLDAIAASAEDPQRAGYLLLRACDTYRREQEIDLARRCYLDLAPNVIPSIKALACYRASQMEVELGRLDRAKRALEELVIDQPSTEGAETGARYLMELAGESSAKERVELAKRLATALAPQAELEENVRALCTFFWLDAGRTAREELAEPDDSAQSLDRAWTLGQDTQWRDELFVERAKTAAAQERLAEAVAVYDAFLDDRETSWFFGSYDSPYLGRAALARGELLERLGRAEEAIEAYEWLVRKLDESKYRDDAAFAAARLRADGGDLSALREFLHNYPESRHARSAKARLEGGT